MAYRLRNASEVALRPGSHPAASEFDKCVGNELGVSAFGLYQVELPGGAETVRHDHRADGAEDAYAVLRGSGVVVVDDDEVRVVPGDFIAVTPSDSTRYVRLTKVVLSSSRCARRSRHSPAEPQITGPGLHAHSFDARGCTAGHQSR